MGHNVEHLLLKRQTCVLKQPWLRITLFQHQDIIFRNTNLGELKYELFIGKSTEDAEFLKL